MPRSGGSSRAGFASSQCGDPTEPARVPARVAVCSAFPWVTAAQAMKEVHMPGKSAHVKNEKQYEALKDKGMSKARAARIANSPDASSHGGKASHSSKSSSSQGG